MGMILFLGGLALLVVGYFTYGRLVERIVGPDDRKTPAVANPDGVDYGEAFLRYQAETFDANGRSPIFPLLFVTIACGIASGAHATQTPRRRRCWRSVVTLLPGMFFTTVVTSFILWTSADKGQPWGLGLPLPVAIACGAAVALAFAAFALRQAKHGGADRSDIVGLDRTASRRSLITSTTGVRSRPSA